MEDEDRSAFGERRGDATEGPTGFDIMHLAAGLKARNLPSLSATMTASPMLDRMDWRISLVPREFFFGALSLHDQTQLGGDGRDHLHQADRSWPATLARKTRSPR